MGHPGWEKKDFAFADCYVAWFTIFHDLQDHVAFDLVEKFRAFIVVIVGAPVRAAHHHADEIFIFPDHLVANRRLQQRAVIFDPLGEVDGRQHGEVLLVVRSAAQVCDTLEFDGDCGG